MTMWQDTGFYKRAQIAPATSPWAAWREFADLDALTIFADNLVPHVLRCEGVLVYDERLAAHIDAGRAAAPRPPGARDPRRAPSTRARPSPSATGMTERDLDNALWYRGQRPEYKARPRHRCRTVYY